MVFGDATKKLIARYNFITSVQFCDGSGGGDRSLCSLLPSRSRF